MTMDFQVRRLLAGAAGIGFACAAAAAPAGAWIERELKPAALHEECMTLAPGNRLEYAFSTPGKLDFNIHYHAGKDVHYPVFGKDAQKLEGNFRPVLKQDYCMMWSNPGAVPAQFRYRFVVHADDPAVEKK